MLSSVSRPGRRSGYPTGVDGFARSPTLKDKCVSNTQYVAPARKAELEGTVPFRGRDVGLVSLPWGARTRDDAVATDQD